MFSSTAIYEYIYVEINVRFFDFWVEENCRNETWPNSGAFERYFQEESWKDTDQSYYSGLTCPPCQGRLEGGMNCVVESRALNDPRELPTIINLLFRYLTNGLTADRFRYWKRILKRRAYYNFRHTSAINGRLHNFIFSHLWPL